MYPLRQIRALSRSCATGILVRKYFPGKSILSQLQGQFNHHLSFPPRLSNPVHRHPSIFICFLRYPSLPEPSLLRAAVKPMLTTPSQFLSHQTISCSITSCARNLVISKTYPVILATRHPVLSSPTQSLTAPQNRKYFTLTLCPLTWG